MVSPGGDVRLGTLQPGTPEYVKAKEAADRADLAQVQRNTAAGQQRRDLENHQATHPSE